MAEGRRNNGGKGKAGADAVDPRPMKALTHPLRAQILQVLSERTASPKELSDELEEPLGNVSYHVKTLKELNCVELVDTQPRRGALEHYYRATPQALISSRDWAKLPASIRPSISANTLKAIVADAGSALDGETLDARPDRQLSRSLLVLDEEGWEEVVDLFEEAPKRLEKIAARSARRLKGSDGEGIRVSASVLAFELPTNGKKSRKKSGRD